MFRALLDTCVLFKALLCDTVLSIAEEGVFYPLDQLDLAPDRVKRALARQASRYRREPRAVEDLLIALGAPGNGCPEFARLCRGDFTSS